MKIRIAVAVGPDGEWRACGGEKRPPDAEVALSLLPEQSWVGAVLYFITAEVPVPQSAEIEGRVE